MANETKLADYLHTQKELAKNITLRFNEIEKQYAASGSALKEALKLILLEKLRKQKTALILVDIQNDFVLHGFALYAPGGENTLISNMALLDALAELLQIHPQIGKQIDLITSQDAHMPARTITNPDVQLMTQSYGQKQTRKILQIEQNELAPFNPEEEQYGLHCLRGTIGVAISQPIESRLERLQEKIPVHRFAKINFSGPEAGMKLRKGIDLSNPLFLNAQECISEEPAQAYSQFIQNNHYDEVLITGICGNVCVQQAAEGLAAKGEKVSVLDPCVHYLIIPGVSTYQKVRSEVEQSYAAKGICSLKLEHFRSNPECQENKNSS